MKYLYTDGCKNRDQLSKTETFVLYFHEATNICKSVHLLNLLNVAAYNVVASVHVCMCVFINTRHHPPPPPHHHHHHPHTELTSGRDKELNDLLDFSAVSTT